MRLLKLKRKSCFSQNSKYSELKSYRIEITKGSTNLLWDEFVLSLDQTSYQQTSAWAKVYERIGWEVVRIIIWQQGLIIGGVQLFVWQLGKFWQIGFIPQGPCLSNVGSELSTLIIESVKKWGKQESLLYLVWDVNYAYPQLSSTLVQKKFQDKINGLPPTAIIRSTSLLDLTKSDDDLVKQMHASRRRNLKKASKYSFDYKMATRDELPLFFDLMKVMCDRREVKPAFKSLQFYYDTWDAFEAINGIKLFFAYYNKELVCAMLCFTLGDTFRFWQWGWSGDYGETNITHSLYWYTIKWARENGFEKYDFVQVDPEVAKAYTEDLPMTESLKSTSFYGPTINKMRWGGEFIVYPGKYMYVPNVLYRFLLYKFGGKFINGSFMIGLRKRLYGKNK